jgi:ectoine/hydroxyectoine ABC transporter permease protein EhuD
MVTIREMISFLPTLLEGARITITVSLVSYLLSLIVGLMFGLGRVAQFGPVRWAAAVYVQFFRGTPLLLQLFFIYYILPHVGIVLSPFTSGVMGLTINYSAYMAEVFRSGIQAISRGQWVAARSLGMSQWLLMRRIILPQAIRVVIPALGNFFVAIFKDSALVSIITMRDLMFSGELLASVTFKHFEVFTLVAIIYFMISYPAAKLVQHIEGRLDTSRNQFGGKLT